MPEKIEDVKMITPYEVSQILHMGQERVRAGLRANTYPFYLFGFAVPPSKPGGKWTYKIMKEKFIYYLNERRVDTNEKES